MEPPKELTSLEFSTKVLNPAKQPWNELESVLMPIESAAFGAGEAFEPEMMRDMYEDPTNVFVLLYNAREKAVGYTCATPIFHSEVPDHHKPKERIGDKETAYIMSTAFLPEYQGRGLVSPLVGTLEKELTKRGYKYIERDSAIDNGYADKIQKHYGNRVIEWYDRTDDTYGHQRYFRIKL